MDPRGEKTARDWDKILTMGDVVNQFSDVERYRARLGYIAGRVRSITGSWARLDPADADTTLAMLQDLAAASAVPPGCGAAQETLLCAMRCYHKAVAGLSRAKATASRAEYEQAWGHVKDGDVLLTLALELAGEA